MLKSSRKGAVALATVLSFVAGAAQAETHVVTIFEGGYFPDVIYIEDGDNVRFQNESGDVHTITGADGNWTSDEIQSGASFVLNLEEDTTLNYSGLGVDGLDMSGEISYDEPPLSNG